MPKFPLQPWQPLVGFLNDDLEKPYLLCLLSLEMPPRVVAIPSEIMDTVPAPWLGTSCQHAPKVDKTPLRWYDLSNFLREGRTVEAFTARISVKYQVVIPKAVREALQIEPRDQLLFLVDGDTVILRPQPESFTGALQGLHKDLWPDPDTWLDEERSSWE